MSRIRYGIYEMPAKNEKGSVGTKTCVRTISYEVVGMDAICDHVTEASALTSAEVKGVLDMLAKFIGSELSHGRKVELEGLGIFSTSLKTKEKGVDKEGKRVYEAEVAGVNFRCSKKLKERVKMGERPQKVKRTNRAKSDYEQRRARLLNYLAQKPYINQTIYQGLTGCTSHVSRSDFKMFEEEGLLQAEGAGSHRIYLLKKKEG